MPDLNSMDFSVWGYLEITVSGKFYSTVNALKAVFTKTWTCGAPPILMNGKTTTKRNEGKVCVYKITIKS
uniref:Uncharacterized protein n=1 Tax=Caenorhabditis japonica TaxID=281687 RepID=A0A8R1ETY4_CAEJA